MICNRRGYGGIFGVGNASCKFSPRIMILEYSPPKNGNSSSTPAAAAVAASGDTSHDNDNKAVAFVTKCIFYDAGRLALMQQASPSSSTSSSSNHRIKADIVGSVGVLGGFVSAVHAGYQHKLYFVLCLAENALTGGADPGTVASGPNNIATAAATSASALRNGDVLQLYSRKTVEVCNTYADGRLLLADGLAHATRHVANLDLVIDMATLNEDDAASGCQTTTTTTRHHAGILTNRQELEMPAVASGLRSGDLYFPMVYEPELAMPDLESKVADMKNSAAATTNCIPCAAAGHFIESHLAEDYKGGWLHIDTTGPVQMESAVPDMVSV